MIPIIFLIIIFPIATQLSPTLLSQKVSLTQNIIGCPPGCLSCTTQTSCNICQNNTQYVSLVNSCVSCLTYGCSSCLSFTNCTQCIYPTININGTCYNSQLINSTCAYCNLTLSNLQIQECYCETCVPGYYSNGDGLCFSCIANCQICTSGNNCSQCLPGYALSIIGLQCVLCPNSVYCPSTCQPGQFYNNISNVCLPCLPGCLQCQSAFSCSACSSGYYLTNQNLCNPCFTGCNNCTSLSQCFSCGSSTALYQQQSMMICINCPSFCQLCQIINQSAICLQCISGTFLVFTETDFSPVCRFCQLGCQICSGPICYLCSDGNYFNNGSCIGCSQIFGQGCLNCSGVSCSICNVGFLLVLGQCLPCPKGCMQCQTSCSQCFSNYFLLGGVCNLCANFLPSCSLCSNSTNCTQCVDEYFVNSSSQCQPCPINCRQCFNSTICSLCLVNFYLDNYTCFPCQTSCSRCVSSTLCTACIRGYFFIQYNLTCQICQQNCLFCTNSTNCNECQDSFILQNGVCESPSQPFHWYMIIIILIGIVLIVLIIGLITHCYQNRKANPSASYESKKTKKSGSLKSYLLNANDSDNMIEFTNTNIENKDL